MSAEPEDYYGTQQDAALLVIAMGRHRDARDACVALGRRLRDTDAERGMPAHRDAEAAVEALDELRHAGRELDSATLRWRRRRAVPQ